MMGGGFAGLLGAFSPEQQQMRQKQEQQVAMAKMLQQMYGGGQGDTPEAKVAQQFAQKQGAQPQQGGLNSPQGGPVPITGAGGTPQGQPQMGGGQQGQPPNYEQQLQKIFSAPGDPLTKMLLADKLMPGLIEQRKEYHEQQLELAAKAREAYYTKREEAEDRRIDKMRDWNDPTQRPQPRESVGDKNTLAAAKDDENKAAARLHDRRLSFGKATDADKDPGVIALEKAYRDAHKTYMELAKGKKSATAGNTRGSDAAAESAEPPAEAVTALKAAPDTAAQFDEIFGEGAAAKILGK